MTKKQAILLSIAIFSLLAFLLFIIVSEHGLVDLIFLKQGQDRLVENNERLTQKNLSISVEIERLKNDPVYIESVARQELGMIGENEIILKSRSQPNRKK